MRFRTFRVFNFSKFSGNIGGYEFLIHFRQFNTLLGGIDHFNLILGPSIIIRYYYEGNTIIVNQHMHAPWLYQYYITSTAAMIYIGCSFVTLRIDQPDGAHAACMLNK